jgi:hypothetical protein
MSWYNHDEEKKKDWKIASVCSDKTVAEGIHVPPLGTVYGTVQLNCKT